MAAATAAPRAAEDGARAAPMRSACSHSGAASTSGGSAAAPADSSQRASDYMAIPSPECAGALICSARAWIQQLIGCRQQAPSLGAIRRVTLLPALLWCALVAASMLLLTAGGASAQQGPPIRMCVATAQRYSGSMAADCEVLRMALMTAGVEWNRAQLCTEEQPVAYPLTSSAAMAYSCFTTRGYQIYSSVALQVWANLQPGLVSATFRKAYAEAYDEYPSAPRFVYITFSSQGINMPSRAFNAVQKWMLAHSETVTGFAPPPPGAWAGGGVLRRLGWRTGRRLVAGWSVESKG